MLLLNFCFIGTDISEKPFEPQHLDNRVGHGLLVNSTGLPFRDVASLFCMLNFLQIGIRARNVFNASKNFSYLTSNLYCLCAHVSHFVS
jgi:hypothetical protein